MIVHGSFEEGTEYNQYYPGPQTYNMRTMTSDGVNFMGNYTARGGIFPFGPLLTDGVGYNMDPSTSGITSGSWTDTHTPTYCYGPVGYFSSPPFAGTSIPAGPSPVGPSNFRFQGGREHNLLLNQDMIPGAKYNLTYRFYCTQTGFTPIPSSITDNFDLEFTPVEERPAAYTVPAIDRLSGTISYSTPGVWATKNTPVFYGGNPGNKFMLIRMIRSSTTYDYAIDNVSLTRDLCPVITSSNPIAPATLTATVPGGGSLNYQWLDQSGNAIPGANTSTYTTSIHGGTFSCQVTDQYGCHCSATFILKPRCPGFTNAAGATTPVTVLSGPLSGTYPPGWYYLSGAETTAVSSIPIVPVVFDNCKILIEKGASIYVNHTSRLHIENGSHLATCPDSADMWKGITLNNDQNNGIRVAGSSLIEDAEIAILSRNLVGQNFPGLIIETDDAIFNRNREAIKIENDPNNVAKYKFWNTVFTSRAIATAFNSWPSTTTLKSGLLPPGYNPLKPPYYLNGYMTPKTCHDGGPALCGLRLSGVGSTTGMGPTSYTYKSLELGSEGAAGRRNLFDNMQYGVDALNSNLLVYNSTFTEMFRTGAPATGGIGVRTRNTGSGILHMKVLTTGPSAPRNEFYENMSGVEAYNYYKAIISRAFFQTSNTAMSSAGVGRSGMILQSSNYRELNADYNEFRNCLNSVYITNLASGFSLSGQIFATGNQILATAAPTTYSASNRAIVIDDLTTSGFSTPHTVHIADNIIQNQFTGISVSNIYQHEADIDQNSVQLYDAGAGNAQYGIHVVNSKTPAVTNNSISSTSRGNDNANAVYMASDMSPYVGCNTETTIGRGFCFANKMLNSTWINNSMTNNLKGFALGGDIGPQGSASTSNGNRWFGSWSTSGGLYQTYTIGNVSPTNSTLYGIGSQEVPVANVNSNFLSAFTYSTTNGLATASSSSWGAPCIPNPKPPFYLRTSMEQTAQDGIRYPSKQAALSWIDQMELYRQMKTDPNMAASSKVLATFQTTALTSRMDWILQIDSLITTGNIAAASKLLSSSPSPAVTKAASGVTLVDGTQANAVVANYSDYYRLLLNWIGSTISSSDSSRLSQLAAKCPFEDGAVVYQARALLRVLTHDMVVYTDNCMESIQQQEKGSNERRVREMTTQQYSLSPNPTNGTIQLQQAKSDAEPVQIKVFNGIGAAVLETARTFKGDQADLDLRYLVPGMYHILLRDSSGASWTLKFVKQ